MSERETGTGSRSINENGSAIREALDRGFMTACSGDGEYQIKISFETLAEMQAAHQALVRASSFTPALCTPTENKG